jgi:hypothetical protein
VSLLGYGIENGGLVIIFMAGSGDLSLLQILHIGYGAHHAYFGTVPYGSASRNMVAGA